MNTTGQNVGHVNAHETTATDTLLDEHRSGFRVLHAGSTAHCSWHRQLDELLFHRVNSHGRKSATNEHRTVNGGWIRSTTQRKFFRHSGSSTTRARTVRQQRHYRSPIPSVRVGKMIAAIGASSGKSGRHSPFAEIRSVSTELHGSRVMPRRRIPPFRRW